MKTVQLKVPNWLTKRFAIACLFVAAAGVGCYFWGTLSVDTEAAINEYLLGEPEAMQKGRRAGYDVLRVGNVTYVDNWVTFCNNVIADCEAILEER